MRVLLTALALMAFAFVLNLMGDFSAASSTGPILRGATSVRVAIEPAPAPAPTPTVRSAQPAKEISFVAPVRRVAVAEKPRKAGLVKSTVVAARPVPEAAKFAAGPAKTMTAKRSGFEDFARA
ncbi:MAG: hypothetical protein JNJ73_16305 [Hyphomonadaceae bacterium]|nr:hypothetical protein [Hyphomonadaceae bacterium]